MSHLEALKLASDTMHELITIDTALIGVMVTFRKDLLGDTSAVQRYALAAAFLALTLSAFFAFYCLTDIVAAADSNKYGPNSGGVHGPAAWATWLFVAGLASYAVVGVAALAARGAGSNGHAPHAKAKTPHHKR